MRGNNGEEQASADSTSSRGEINVNMMKILHAQQTLSFFSPPFFLVYLVFHVFFHYYFLGFGLFMGFFKFF
jgi:hypothetical protein